jgi:hypothetical protein
MSVSRDRQALYKKNAGKVLHQTAEYFFSPRNGSIQLISQHTVCRSHRNWVMITCSAVVLLDVTVKNNRKKADDECSTFLFLKLCFALDKYFVSVR